MSMMTNSSKKTHVLVFPYPAQGHMLPLFNLTHHLALRGNNHLLLTVLVTPKNLPILQPLLSSHPSIETLLLPFPPHPSIPQGIENVKDLPVHSFVYMMHALRALHSPIVAWFRAHPNPPVAIISDMFLGWTHFLAAELGIKRIEFSPSGAFALSVIYSLWKNMPVRSNVNPNEGEDDVLLTFDEVPSCPKYPWAQLSTVFRSYVKGDPVSEMIRLGFVGNMGSYGLVVNTFDEMEGVYLEYLRKKALAHGRVWAVGPLLPAPVALKGGRSGSVSAEEITSWLDARDDETVVYVCFGSQAVLTDDQLSQLALGLEKSGAHFVMCVKGSTADGGGHVEDGDCAILRGLRRRVAGRGLVLRGWAPQVEILGHRAVGAFLTHCGWNSVLEGVTAGVALLCWPMGADQYSDATLLVEQLGVGVSLCEGARTVPDSSVVARVVADAVSEKHVELRKRVKALREAALGAVREGGSSVKDLDGLVDHLVTLQN